MPSFRGRAKRDGAGKAARFSTQAGWMGGKTAKGRTGRKGAPRVTGTQAGRR